MSIIEVTIGVAVRVHTTNVNGESSGSLIWCNPCVGGYIAHEVQKRRLCTRDIIVVNLVPMRSGCEFDFSLGQMIMLILAQGKSVYSPCPLLYMFHVENIVFVFWTPSETNNMMPVNHDISEESAQNPADLLTLADTLEHVHLLRYVMLV